MHVFGCFLPTSAWEADRIVSETGVEVTESWIVMVVLVEEGTYHGRCVSYYLVIYRWPLDRSGSSFQAILRTLSSMKRCVSKDMLTDW